VLLLHHHQVVVTVALLLLLLAAGLVRGGCVQLPGWREAASCPTPNAGRSAAGVSCSLYAGDADAATARGCADSSCAAPHRSRTVHGVAAPGRRPLGDTSVPHRVRSIADAVLLP
jgi:hypothetical protein